MRRRSEHYINCGYVEIIPRRAEASKNINQNSGWGKKERETEVFTRYTIFQTPYIVTIQN